MTQVSDRSPGAFFCNVLLMPREVPCAIFSHLPKELISKGLLDAINAYLLIAKEGFAENGTMEMTPENITRNNMYHVLRSLSPQNLNPLYTGLLCLQNWFESALFLQEQVPSSNMGESYRLRDDFFAQSDLKCMEFLGVSLEEIREKIKLIAKTIHGFEALPIFADYGSEASAKSLHAIVVWKKALMFLYSSSWPIYCEIDWIVDVLISGEPTDIIDPEDEQFMAAVACIDSMGIHAAEIAQLLANFISVSPDQKTDPEWFDPNSTTVERRFWIWNLVNRTEGRNGNPELWARLSNCGDEYTFEGP